VRRGVLGLLAAGVVLLPATAAAAGRCGDHPWCDTTLSADARAGMLLQALTPDEKIGLLAGDDLTGVCACYPGSHTGTENGVPRLDVPRVLFSDGPVGPRQGQATAMPIPMALAATFDRSLAVAHGAVIGDEARHKGNDIVFGPTVNIMRTPLAGRTFEAYGEDPYLDSQMAVGWIRGLQAQGVIADVKHFAANNQEGASPLANAGAPGQPLGPPAVEGNRMLVDERIDERTLREVYLPHFEAAIKQAHAGTVMCSYNHVNGTYACENDHLIHQILEKEWGFDGMVLADYGAAHDAGASLRGGLDFEPWPGLAYGPLQVRLALTLGQGTQAQVDEHVRRYLRTLFAFGVFDRAAYADDDSRIAKAAHAQTAQGIEESAITLLENRRHTLPLGAPKTIAVIGEPATTFTTGGGSGNVKPFAFHDPLTAIKRRAAGAKVVYDDGSDPARAAATAKAADVAIVFAADYQSEGADRACLTLECPDVHGDQDGLIERVAAAQPQTVVVLETGGPVLTPWRDRVAALLEAWYPGQEGGPAIARVLFGDADPGGRLPATFPRSEADLPTAGDPEAYPGVGETETYKEGLLVGYRFFDARAKQPAYPFGFGRSYTRFRFSKLAVRRRGPRVKVALTVRNAGARAGAAVPQVYVAMPPAAGEPPRQLKAFAKLRLDRGEARRVRFTLGRRAFAHWADGWQVTPGCYRVLAGSSSRALPLRRRVAMSGGSCGARTTRYPHRIRKNR
jgi:beta-glucosidase